MAALWNYRARITLRAPADAVVPKIPPAAWVLQAFDDQTCIVDAGADTPTCLPVYLGARDVDWPTDTSALPDSQPTSRLALISLATHATLGLVAVTALVAGVGGT